MRSIRYAPILVGTGLLALALVAGTERPAVGGQAAVKLKVAVILPTTGNDLSWSQALHVGLQRMEKEGTIEYQFTERVAPADAERVLRRYAERGADLIIAHSGTYKDAVFRVAKEFPNLKFAWPSFGTQDHDKNLAAYDTPVWEASYLAGQVAAHITKSGKLGFVGGLALPGCKAIFNGFRDGAASVKSGLEVLQVYVGDFNDVAKAKALALSLHDRGADVFSICGNGPARGTIEAARERGVWGVGYVYDMASLAPKNVLGSLFWDSYKGIGQLLDDIRANTFLPAKYYSGKAKEGITTFKLNEEVVPLLPPAAVQGLKASITKLEKGELQIPISFQ
jgi:simple sugar transport system substrate-binding protein/basic membrane protein A